MNIRDDYFYCSAFDCPGEHPIPGMTCGPFDEDAPEDTEPEPQPRPEWCADPDTCTQPEHQPRQTVALMHHSLGYVIA